jgi:hypothetical protein
MQPAYQPGAPATGASARRWRSGLVGELLLHMSRFLESALRRLGFCGGHDLDAPGQSRSITGHPASEARPPVRKRIDLVAKNAQFFYARMERGPVGGILDRPNGHTELLRRGQGQEWRPCWPRLFRGLGADQRLWLGRCGSLPSGAARNVCRCGIRRLGRSSHHTGRKHRRTAEEGCRAPLRASRVGAAARRHGQTAQQGRHPENTPATRFLAHEKSLPNPDDPFRAVAD